MINEKYKIILEKNSERFFSYTDKLNSYLMLHASKPKLSDGFICNNLCLFNDFYLKVNSKKLFRTSADYTELYSDHCTIYFNSVNVKVEIYVPVKSASVIFKIINPNEKNVKLVLKLFTKNVHIERTRKTEKKFIICENLITKKSNDEIEKLLAENTKHYEEIENHLIFDAGDEEINKALYWAQISGNKLCCGGEGAKGIWAGLPWFRENWGRDTFIALPGILLVNGFFDEAKQVLACFLKHQKKDPKSHNYGRIPNRYVNERDVIYNTADGNLWFIKALWQYLQYSGDKDFLNEIWENVKLAVFCDLDMRTDMNGYLLNNDSDTWMDARIRGKEPLSARGNRANDIQALWFDSLNIFVKLSEIMESTERVSDVKKVIEDLRKNFTKDYWNAEKEILADRIDIDDTKDYVLRANTSFCVNMEFDLLEKEIQKSIVKNSFERLVLPFGVASLSPLETDFHPYHIGCKMYHKDAAYHNGAIWLWLSGPMNSSLCKVDWQNEAWKLSKNHCHQIFETGCAGTLSENANAALDRKGKMTPSGTWSQAWSVSEFTRNFYQDYIGIKPHLLENKIYFNPKMPHEWNAGNTILLIGNGKIKISWSNEKVETSKDNNVCGIRKFDFEILSGEFKDLSIKLCASNEEKKFDANGKLSVDVKIFSDSTELKFVELKPLEEYECLKKHNYIFEKIKKEYKHKAISEVN